MWVLLHVPIHGCIVSKYTVMTWSWPSDTYRLYIPEYLRRPKTHVYILEYPRAYMHPHKHTWILIHLCIMVKEFFYFQACWLGTDQLGRGGKERHQRSRISGLLRCIWPTHTQASQGELTHPSYTHEASGRTHAQPSGTRERRGRAPREIQEEGEGAPS